MNIIMHLQTVSQVKGNRKKLVKRKIYLRRLLRLFCVYYNSLKRAILSYVHYTLYNEVLHVHTLIVLATAHTDAKGRTIG